MTDLLTWHKPGQKVVTILDGAAIHAGMPSPRVDSVLTIKKVSICSCKGAVTFQFVELMSMLDRMACGSFDSKCFRPVVEDKPEAKQTAKSPLDDLYKFAANPTFDPDGGETSKPRVIEHV